MSVIAVKAKIMPESPETDLEKIKEEATKLIESGEGKNPDFKEEPVAFGLKALVFTFAWPEDKELEELENGLGKIEGVSSIETLDIRRAIG